MRAKPPSHWQVFKRVSWLNRITMAAGAATVALSLFNLTAALLLGPFIGWSWSEAARHAIIATMAWGLIRWVYWESRAKEAEKPLPANQAIITYSTPEAAAVARWVEEKRREEAAVDA